MKFIISLLSFVAVCVSADERNCESKGGKEEDLSCMESMMINSFASTKPFFSDAVSPDCLWMQEHVFSDEEEIYTFNSRDGGMSLTAECPNEHQVINKLKMCKKNDRVTSITLHCQKLINPDWIVGPLEASSDDMNHASVSCGTHGALRKIDLMDSGEKGITKAVIGCLKLRVHYEEE